MAIDYDAMSLWELVRDLRYAEHRIAALNAHQLDDTDALNDRKAIVAAIARKEKQS